MHLLGMESYRSAEIACKNKIVHTCSLELCLVVVVVVVVFFLTKIRVILFVFLNIEQNRAKRLQVMHKRAKYRLVQINSILFEMLSLRCIIGFVFSFLSLSHYRSKKGNYVEFHWFGWLKTWVFLFQSLKI